MPAAAAGAIPIVSEELHTGRSSAERSLPYYYVLKAAAEARLHMGRALPYCERWGKHNARTFLEHQTIGGLAWAQGGDREHCRLPPYAP